MVKILCQSDKQLQRKLAGTSVRTFRQTKNNDTGDFVIRGIKREELGLGVHTRQRESPCDNHHVKAYLYNALRDEVGRYSCLHFAICFAQQLELHALHSIDDDPYSVGSS